MKMCLNNSDNDQNLTILVNTKYSRITIHKSTLKALREPAFIQLGYNAGKRRLMLFGVDTPSQNTIRIRLNKKGYCYIHSKSFMEGLMSVSDSMKEQGTYLLKGELDKQLTAAYFSLSEAEKCFDYADKGEER